MDSPVILVVPALMLVDYHLAMVGAKASLGVYHQHFTPPFVMNPFWNKSVQRLRWFNPRLFVIVGIVTALLLLLDDPDLLVGILIGAFGLILGRNLDSLLLFRYLNRHPDEIEGHVHLTHQLVFKTSLFHTLGIVPLLGLIAVLVPEPMVIGAFLGILSLAFAHLVWARKARSHEYKARDEPKEADGRPDPVPEATGSTPVN